MYEESNYHMNMQDMQNSQNDQNNNENHFPWDEQGVNNPSTPPVPPKKKHSHTGKVIALALCCSLVGGMAGAGGMYFATRNSGNSPASASNYLQGKRETSVLNLNQIDSSKEMTPSEVYAKNVNSTVGITTSITTNFWGYQTTSAASGSGFILTDDGYILTNHHVIEGSSSITVSMYDGTTYEADLIGYDVANDIAVLKIDATDLVPVVLGNSDNMNVGDSVLAIGNPLGELTFSLTSGAISALDREITMQNGSSMNLIQTDCAINSGNSGGALFNMYGEVVGITNAKYSGSSGGGATIDNIGFAIPITHVWDIVESIIEKGYISKPYIGVSVSDVSAELQSYGMPAGAAVRSVAENGPAKDAGIQEKDIITQIDGKEITGSSDLIDTIRSHEIGDTLNITVFRQGENVELTLKIGEKIQSAQEMAQN